METFGAITGVILTAVAIALIFYFVLKVKGPWGNFWTFFVVLFLSIWAASLWVSPFGPVYWGIAWIPLLFIGIIVALLLSAMPSPPANTETSASDNGMDENASRKDFGIGVATLSGIFWMFLVILLVAVVIGYTF
ncbi:hypothetical protein [Nafulsella turpanensis]|uniref:hypothetical protein n=1 Tax=Nafulsella turpanensis TaxID=1265690 RepID=UPI0003456217|nr:hypothetical protein [Nafulsella turpanensis]